MAKPTWHQSLYRNLSDASDIDMNVKHSVNIILSMWCLFYKCHTYPTLRNGQVWVSVSSHKLKGFLAVERQHLGEWCLVVFTGHFHWPFVKRRGRVTIMNYIIRKHYLKPHCTYSSYLLPLYRNFPNQCLLVPHDALFLRLIESWVIEIATCQWPRCVV